MKAITDGAALFMVEFAEDDYSLNTGNAIAEIQAILGDRGAVGIGGDHQVHAESTIRRLFQLPSSRLL